MIDRFKFRIWDKKQNQYREGGRHIADTCIDCLSGKVLFGEGAEIYGEEDDSDVVLEQCTGLKDKNGKLIYEGDILGDGGFIKWCDECKSFSIFCDEHCFSCNGDILWAEIVEEDGNLEVIGNIHENEDLL